MINGDLIEILMNMAYTDEVKLECTFELDKPTAIRSVVRKEGVIVIRDHFLESGSDAQFKSFDGQLYEVKYDHL